MNRTRLSSSHRARPLQLSLPPLVLGKHRLRTRSAPCQGQTQACAL
jgi:hypothetical protein